MNRVYLAMVQRLRPPDKENSDPRGDLDRELDVASWSTPRTVHQINVGDAGAPAWWRGDEDATATFLRGMGVSSLEELARRG